ncbi:MAG: flagellar biosynthesis anti-sigma factor FlgM [Bacillota bacterium]|nr:flagellar biosynthesis anti-sigma factor FlgM [Bacillota bacterium]
MKIDPVVLKSVIGTYNRVVHKDTPVEPTKPVKDEVSLSDNAKILSSAVKAAKASEDVSMQKVKEIASKVSSGTYEVNSQKVAEKIVNQALFDKRV